ncbi:unnamed protein product [Pleuronectes platessa]|uniref:Uncharacterized protein n=1 Tax=Pleuronectes platessa TaxID=8262 RepID=A0A9N7UDJ6_PLEPL|nr:unnamed protein product [Pleuronectes platessa]
MSRDEDVVRAFRCRSYQSVSAPSRSLELGSQVILDRCPDRSMKKEEEMFLYLECSHFISRIYSRSNTRITSSHTEANDANGLPGQTAVLEYISRDNL